MNPFLLHLEEYKVEYEEQLEYSKEVKIEDTSKGTPLEALTLEVKKYINSKKNLENVCNGSNGGDEPSTFIVFKHLINTDKLFYISILLENGIYDIDYDCNNGIYGTTGYLQDEYENFSKLKKDIDKMIDEIDETEKFDTMISFSINTANRAFLTYYIMCKMPEPPPIRGFVMA